MRKIVKIGVGLVIVLFITTILISVIRFYWHGFNRFGDSSAASEQYLRTNMTAGKTTLTEVQTFMKEQVYGGAECVEPAINSSLLRILNCQVEGFRIGCGQWGFDIQYTFKAEILSDISVKPFRHNCI